MRNQPPWLSVGFEYYKKHESLGGAFNWNAASIHNADGDDVPINASGDGCQVQRHEDIKSFSTLTGNLEHEMADWIRKADFVFCCFAWLTNRNVLDALAGLEKGCQVIVQKEDFLRPDSGHSPQSNAELRAAYGRLRCGVYRHSLPSIASSLSTSWDDAVDAVRCAGLSIASRKVAVPRMHHKFAVACKCHFDDRSMSHCFEPYSVWTGSFNPTSNGTRSRENAVIIESESTANFYLKEWAKMFAMSEPLDWYHEWCAPQYRIGT